MDCALEMAMHQHAMETQRRMEGKSQRDLYNMTVQPLLYYSRRPNSINTPFRERRRGRGGAARGIRDEVANVFEQLQQEGFPLESVRHGRQKVEQYFSCYTCQRIYDLGDREPLRSKKCKHVFCKECFAAFDSVDGGDECSKCGQSRCTAQGTEPCPNLTEPLGRVLVKCPFKEVSCCSWKGTYAECEGHYKKEHGDSVDVAEAEAMEQRQQAQLAHRQPAPVAPSRQSQEDDTKAPSASAAIPKSSVSTHHDPQPKPTPEKRVASPPPAAMQEDEETRRRRAVMQNVALNMAQTGSPGPGYRTVSHEDAFRNILGPGPETDIRVAMLREELREKKRQEALEEESEEELEEAEWRHRNRAAQQQANPIPTAPVSTHGDPQPKPAPKKLAASPPPEEEKGEDTHRCSKCNAAKAKFRCTRCNSSWYCDEKCQKAHWKKHKKECKKVDTQEGCSADTKANELNLSPEAVQLLNQLDTDGLGSECFLESSKPAHLCFCCKRIFDFKTHAPRVYNGKACTHHFCLKCVSASRPGECPKCMARPKSFGAAEKVEAELSKVQVKCPFHKLSQCQWTGNYSDCEGHYQRAHGYHQEVKQKEQVEKKEEENIKLPTSSAGDKQKPPPATIPSKVSKKEVKLVECANCSKRQEISKSHGGQSYCGEKCIKEHQKKLEEEKRRGKSSPQKSAEQQQQPSKQVAPVRAATTTKGPPVAGAGTTTATATASPSLAGLPSYVQQQAASALPLGWTRAKTSDGRVFYLDHNTRKTQWDAPPMKVTGMGQMD